MEISRKKLPFLKIDRKKSNNPRHGIFPLNYRVELEFLFAFNHRVDLEFISFNRRVELELPTELTSFFNYTLPTFSGYGHKVEQDSFFLNIVFAILRLVTSYIDNISYIIKLLP